MITAWQLYWILILDNIREATIVFSAISIVFAVLYTACTIVLISSDNNKENIYGRRMAWFISIPWIATILFALCGVFLPTTKQMATILVLPRILTEENIDKIEEETGELYTLTKKWLEYQVVEKEGK